MCLAVPARVVALDGSVAVLESRGAIVRADASLVALNVGDYVLVQAGLVTQVLDPREAEDQLRLLADVFPESAP